MEFSSTNEAGVFWVSYGGQKDLEVRKRWSNKRKSDEKVRSCRFVCANEGHKLKDKMDQFNKVKLEVCLCIFKKNCRGPIIPICIANGPGRNK
jgi:hypothetical protein